MTKWITWWVIVGLLVCAGCGPDDDSPPDDAQAAVDTADGADVPPPCKDGRLSLGFPDSPLAADNIIFFGSLIPMGPQDAQRIILDNSATNMCELDVTRVTSIVTSSVPGLIELFQDNQPLPDSYTSTIQPGSSDQIDVFLFAQRAISSIPGCSAVPMTDVPQACLGRYNDSQFDPYRDTACAAVFIETSDPDRPCEIALVSVTEGGGTLQIEGDLGSSQRITFQSANAGEPAQTEDITLRNVGISSLTVNWSLAGLQLDSEFEIQPSAGTIPAGGEQTYTLTYTPISTDPMMSQDRGTLLLTTNDPGNSSVPLSVRVGDPDAGVLNVSPTTLDFGGVPMGSSRTESITVNNSGALNSLTVNLTLAPSTASSDYTVQCRDSAGATAESCPRPLIVPSGEDRFVDVTYAPTMGTPLSARLIVSAQDNMSAEVTLDAVGSGGALAASPTQIEFQNVMVGQAESLQVTLRNNTSSGVALTAFNTAGPDCAQFEPRLQNSMESLPLAIGPGGVTAVDVLFTRPASDTTGTAAACDIIFVNDGSTPMLTVPARYVP